MLVLIKIILITLMIIAAAILAFAAARPNSFRVERSTTIKAPAANIFAQINDLPGWIKWSPYEKKDPAMKRTLSGPSAGVGAIYEWDGNKNVGKGRMEIVESIPSSRIVIKLDFFAPFKATNTAEFTLEPQGDNTKVTWAMYGPQYYMMKVMGLFMNCDKMVGDDFAAGLTNLKSLTEQK